ncbi:rho-related BTB domain-containing protein 1 isoform X1 [Trichogramma pretiosum]|uniref:rho-related BTB domain-containing protein 1 isoform X1 n=1 Tax=Trichogramma pretiosum TaxID=7493 RepID=UPI0006C9E49D|nr:rho-related BTB domain-containing protein 1 isoform X1 [Trichogramma pretiosum]XP_014222158.1 rho-related BTB domain-containing protein 1 isoform X1 [Trichogramma pretiosum]
MDNEQPHQELVKCVVVGDTAVGKTRLICARACNKHVSLSQLLTTHVPTVWAIDQYRIYKDVLERSWEVVDNVNVSLRLWDTFGDHEKDRRFAYGRSDVVLLCFSITNPVSLRNCKAMWYPEIRRFCPHTPVLLVGCKNDLRYMYRDEAYLSHFRDRGAAAPFVRATRKSDLVMPDEARAVARELGVHYYETSVFTYYGVNEVFENSIRAALIARRQQRFWMTNLKKVQRPLPQAPFCPPEPRAPELQLATSSYEDNIAALWQSLEHTDVVLVCADNNNDDAFEAHRCFLAAASPAFHRLFTMDVLNNHQQQQLGTPRSSSDSSTLGSFGEATVGEFNDDTECLIRLEQSKANKVWDQIKRRSSFQVMSSHESQRRAIGATRELNHPAFQSIRVVVADNGNGTFQQTTLVTLSKIITGQALQQCLQFIYTGNLDKRCHHLKTSSFGLLLEVRQAAEFLEIPQLLMLLDNGVGPSAGDLYIHGNVNRQFKHAVRQRLEALCLEQGLFADVVFELDDGSLPAHRAILTARCDMMKAMLSGDFRESTAKIIAFPGVREYTFHKLLCYLYTDEIPAISSAKCLNLLELANRLCLPRLVNLVEARVIEDLEKLAKNETDNTSHNPEDQGGSGSSNEAMDNCLRLLELCKLHNADQLADWCMNYLCVNYNRICRASPRSLKLLHPDNQEYLSEHRWPPVWYLKDYDYYQKCLAEQDRETKVPVKRSSSPAGKQGCLCFSTSNSRSRSASRSRKARKSAATVATAALQKANSEPLRNEEGEEEEEDEEDDDDDNDEYDRRHV